MIDHAVGIILIQRGHWNEQQRNAVSRAVDDVLNNDIHGSRRKYKMKERRHGFGLMRLKPRIIEIGLSLPTMRIMSSQHFPSSTALPGSRASGALKQHSTYVGML
jgi:hypothetical protein